MRNLFFIETGPKGIHQDVEVYKKERNPGRSIKGYPLREEFRGEGSSEGVIIKKSEEDPR